MQVQNKKFELDHSLISIIYKNRFRQVLANQSDRQINKHFIQTFLKSEINFVFIDLENPYL